MSCNHHCYDCHIPNCPQRVRQSIGPRVVPMFADPPEWSADKVYSPLTLVLYNGATYMSRCCVPAGSPLPSEDPFYNKYWVMVYDMSAQVAQYREEVAKLSEKVTAFEGQIVEWEDMVEKWTALIMDWQSQFPTLTEGLAKITERVAALEPVVAQHTADIAALKQKDTDLDTRLDSAESRLDNLEPRMTAAEGEISGLHTEQETQNNRLDALDQEQLQQDAQIKANHDLAVKNQQNINSNLVQIQENAKNIKANAAEIADHAAQLENIHNTNAEQDAAIANNADAIEQNKTDIDQAEALAQQAQDTATHADATASQAQTTAQAAQEAAQAAQSAADQAKADNTTQDGRLDALEAKQTAQGGRLDSLESAQQQTAQDVANLKDGSTELPYVKKVNGNATGTLAVENLSVSGTATVGEPVNDTDAASKKYVDQAVQNATGGITPDVSKLKQDVAALQESQTTQDSQISAAAQTAQTAQETAQAAKTAADQAAQDVASIKNGSTALPYIKDTGDTVTGNYDFTGGTLQVAAPTRPADAATKQYVDAAVGQATDPALTARVEALETSQTQQDTEIANLKNGSTALPYVKKAGDSMTGVLNMSNNKVTNVADPTANGDAVNKKYVDDKATETETTLKEYVDGHSGGFENAVIVGLYDITKTSSIPREANNDYLFIILPQFSNASFRGLSGTIRNGSNQGVDGYDQSIVASPSSFIFTGNGYVMVYRVAVTPEPGPDIDQGFPPAGYEKSTNKITYVDMTPFGTHPKSNPGTFEKNCKSLPEPGSSTYMFYWDNITYDVPLNNDGEDISSEYKVLAAISSSDSPGGGSADYVAIKVHDIKQNYDFWTEDVSGQIQY